MALNNEVRLIGYCAARPKLITTKKGGQIASISLYTFDAHKQSIDAESERHRCVFLGKNAERAARLIGTGTHVHLSGYLRHRFYTHESGIKISASEILVEDFMLSPKEKATTMFRRNVREMMEEGGISPEDLGE